MKIKEEQLKQVKEYYTTIDKVVFDIGIVETKKHSLLHEVARLNELLENYKKELQSEYGDVNIDMETGEYTEIEKEVEELEAENV
tara:strand:- start:934 stop:1188 length:255 start_codon:yes stop_codon:yes gene_type:complete